MCAEHFRHAVDRVECRLCAKETDKEQTKQEERRETEAARDACATFYAFRGGAAAGTAASSLLANCADPLVSLSADLCARLLALGLVRVGESALSF